MIRYATAALIALACLCSPAYAACLVTGDSIAVGMGSVLRGCRTVARVGAGSAEIAGYAVQGWPLYLNSVGTNDNPGGARGLRANLERLRARQAPTAQRIVWFVPRFEPARSIVVSFAAANADPTCTAARWNGFHPAGYRTPALACLESLHPLPPMRP